MVPLQIDGSLCETLIDFCKQNWFVLLTDLVHSRQWGVSGFESWQKKKKKETVMHSNEYVNIETCHENAKKKFPYWEQTVTTRPRSLSPEWCFLVILWKDLRYVNLEKCGIFLCTCSFAWAAHVINSTSWRRLNKYSVAYGTKNKIPLAKTNFMSYGDFGDLIIQSVLE